MEERIITSKHIDDKDLQNLYHTAFPEGEQIPWDDLLRLIDDMSLDFTAYYDDGEFVGFTIIYPRPSYNWLWYFAVRSDLRGRGLGQQILSHLGRKYKGQNCVLDMESPLQTDCDNIELRKRRHDFYLRNGFHDTHIYRRYYDIEMTIMMMGEGTFTMDNWDEVLLELRKFWNWDKKFQNKQKNNEV